ncbi:EAL domain-containing protein [Lacticaseibacillus zhaodongensis]|uniref:EAL domain-containing protein n=1 Tax=Lacticaseibacillus zhaodongensis TaxID=2668065 RepID=UPI0012D2C6A9|nr:GGDEF and EAL domain-containing protein [Lacticaseibacillus zhaodongensis]
MGVGMITISYVTTLLLSIFLALGMTSLLYWVNDRSVAPFIVAHRTMIVRIGGLIYLWMLYMLQDMQYHVDPQMHVFGMHWPFLNLMLVSLYTIAVRTGDWPTIIIQELCCFVYLLHYANPLGPLVIAAYISWVVILCGLIVIRQWVQKNRLRDYLGLFVLGLIGIIGIYVSQPRTFDPWWWLRELLAYAIVGIAVGEYIRLTVTADARTGALQRAAAYDQMTSEAVFANDQTDMDSMFQDAQDRHEQMVIAAIDVDQFSSFDQHYGYLSGNLVLLTIADMIQNTVHDAKVTARLYRASGEEFTLGFLGITPEQAATVVNDCRERIANKRFPVNGGYAHLTVSAGLTVTQQEDPSIGSAFARADDNLRVCKQRGQNQIYGSGVTIDGDEPVLTYFAQPIVKPNKTSAETWGAELLLRQQDGDHWHLPGRFDIGVEEQIALMTKVITSSNLKRMDINLTRDQFADTNFAKALAGFTKAAYGPEKLVVEITSVPDLSAIRRITSIYRSAGINIFIDDVGSDNSYELVKQVLPYIDGIKFAMQNLRKHESPERIRERVQFWADTAKKANIELILEGVESQADVEFATSLGIQYCQGFYFGKPALPAA